jgi:transposase
LRRRHVLAFFQKLPPCLVGIEACASSHHWSRELQPRPRSLIPIGQRRRCNGGVLSLRRASRAT